MAIVELLADASRAQGPVDFPTDPGMARQPGLYAWWADDSARRLLGGALEVELPALIYAGQAGATRWPSGASSRATLASRIGAQHIRGNARSSTFRLTVSALLRPAMSLKMDQRGRLVTEDNRRVSAWIAQHLRVSIAPFPDRDRLGGLEAAVLGRLDPPLNLGRCLPTHARGRLSELRRALRAAGSGAQGVDGIQAEGADGGGREAP